MSFTCCWVNPFLAYLNGDVPVKDSARLEVESPRVLQELREPNPGFCNLVKFEGVDLPEDKFSLEKVAIGIRLLERDFAGEPPGRDAVERLEASRW